MKPLILRTYWSEASLRLLGELVTPAPPRNREVEAEKARERGRKRFATTAAG